MKFERFINKEVIPLHWEIVSSRIDFSEVTMKAQRMRIIDEIIEYFDAREAYEKNHTVENYKAMSFEYADIALAICTLLKLQGRTYKALTVVGTADPEDLIKKVLQRATDDVLTLLYDQSCILGIDLIQSMIEKMEFNKTRKDWTR